MADGWKEKRVMDGGLVGVGLTSPFFGTPFEYNDNWEDGYIHHENQRKYQQITLNQLKQNNVCGNM